MTSATKVSTLTPEAEFKAALLTFDEISQEDYGKSFKSLLDDKDLRRRSNRNPPRHGRDVEKAL
jgi:hypothetical protein